jgi:ketosteroid isomerase-like protein
MNEFRKLILAVALATPLLAVAHGNEKHEAAMQPGRDVANATLDVPAGATDAIATLERFSTALARGDMGAVGRELAPDVLILESGGAERSADEYLSGHAKNDAAFLGAAHVALQRRKAIVAGDLVVVASESDIHAKRDGKPLAISSTETVVLRRAGDAWKIAHIHWSSRAKKDAH